MYQPLVAVSQDAQTDSIHIETQEIDVDIELKKPQVKALHESEKSGNIEASDNKDS